MAADNSDAPKTGWEIEDWERALTIHVGAAHRCRKCGNLVMVTRGGVGVMELKCCGALMEKVTAASEEET